MVAQLDRKMPTMFSAKSRAQVVITNRTIELPHMCIDDGVS